MKESKEKLFNILTICRKAGKMTMGFDPVKDSILNGKAKAVLIASDISAKTEKEVRFFAAKSCLPVALLPVTISEIEFGLGKKAGVIGICDEGFAAKLAALSEQ